MQNKQKTNMKYLFKPTVYIFFFIFSFTHLSSQELLEEIPLEQQIKNATTIIEGKVISKESFWDNDYNLIYTVNTLEVNKVFKGEPISKINVVTMGGIVNESSLTVNPSLTLNLNDIGLITLENFNTNLVDYDTTKGKLYKPYCNIQSFYKYDILDSKVTNPFLTLQSKLNFNLLVEKMIGIASISIPKTNDNENLKDSTSNNLVLRPSNINFSPSTVPAGAQSQLVITGNGFGNQAGFVFFKDPDDLGVSFVQAPSSHIINWSDTRIVILVPSQAGSGTIRVQDINGNISESTNRLSIPYSLTNLGDVTTQHVDLNGQGGITWQKNIEFSRNTLANNAALRAINTWRCETGINWVIGEDTTVSETNRDGVNVITFGELPRGNLGITFVYGSACTDNAFFIVDVDIIMRDTNVINWNFGPGPTTNNSIDFETTFLHELGHAHLLGHVIDDNDLMHASITTGVEIRALGENNIAAGGIIHDHSTQRSICRGLNLMETFVCPIDNSDLADEVLSDDEILGEDSEALRVFPNPNTGLFFIEGAPSLNLERAVIFDVSGRLIKEIDLAGVTNSATVDLSGASSGLYFVNIYYNNTKEVKKVLVE